MRKLITWHVVLFISFHILIVFPKLNAQKLESMPNPIFILKQKIENICEEYDIPGATVALVSKDSIVWTGNIGMSDVANGEAVGSESIFRWGSVSKSFVSVSIMMLVEQGLINLDDKIRDIIPEIEFENQWEDTHPIRIAHCLEHTAGFDDLHFTDCAIDDPDIKLFDALKINPKSRVSRWKPGTYMSYSNIGPVVAAYIVEKVSGQTFETFVQENIFNILEMKTASFYYPQNKALMSKGYGDDSIISIKYDHIAYRPAGSLNTSAIELANFIKMLLKDGKFKGKVLLNPESVLRIETPKTSTSAQVEKPFGYGLGNYTSMYDGIAFHGHDGFIAGFSASYKYNSDLNSGFALAINKESSIGIEQIENAIYSFLTSGFEKPVLPEINISKENLTAFVGYYRQITPMTQLLNTLLIRFVDIRKIIEKNGKLYSSNYFKSKPKELIPISQTTFIRNDSHNRRLTMIADSENVVISHDIFGGNYKKVMPFSVYLEIGIFLFIWLIMLSSVLFALIWIPRTMLGRMKKVPYLKARFYSFLAVVIFLVIYTLLLSGVLQIESNKALMMKLGSFSILSATIFIFSLCFAVFSILGLWYSIRAFTTKMNKLAQIHTLLVSVANVMVVAYLFLNDIIGIRTWTY